MILALSLQSSLVFSFVGGTDLQLCDSLGGQFSRTFVVLGDRTRVWPKFTVRATDEEKLWKEVLKAIPGRGTELADIVGIAPLYWPKYTFPTNSRFNNSTPYQVVYPKTPLTIGRATNLKLIQAEFEAPKLHWAYETIPIVYSGPLNKSGLWKTLAFVTGMKYENKEKSLELLPDFAQFKKRFPSNVSTPISTQLSNQDLKILFTEETIRVATEAQLEQGFQRGSLSFISVPKGSRLEQISQIRFDRELSALQNPEVQSVFRQVDRELGTEAAFSIASGALQVVYRPAQKKAQGRILF